MTAVNNPISTTTPGQADLDFLARVKSARALEHQVAGHDGVLASEDGHLIVKPCTPTEVAFYQLINGEGDHADMLEFLPKFYGAVELDDQGSGVVGPSDVSKRKVKDCIALENLLNLYRKPCVMDVKLGTQLYDEFCSEEKKERMREAARATTSLKLGFRITGIKVYDPSKREFITYDKFFGKNLTEETVHSGFTHYFDAAEQTSPDYRREIARSLLDAMVRLKDVMLKKEFRMYASSVLLVYEGDPQSEQQQQQRNLPTTLKMIDFAHSYHVPGQGRDEGHILGLTNTIEHISKLAQ